MVSMMTRYNTAKKRKADALFLMQDVPMTPWFKLICDTFLFKWWEKIDALESEKDENTIHRLGF